jgi:hypothetical protein
MNESEIGLHTRPEREAHPLTSEEAKDIFNAFCDGEIQILEERRTEIEGWPAEVHTGTNRRKSHEINNLLHQIRTIENLRRYAEGLFNRINRIPNVKTDVENHQLDLS